MIPSGKKLAELEGQYVWFFNAGDADNGAVPLLVTSVEPGGMVNGHVFTDTTSFIVKDCRHIEDPWVQDPKSQRQLIKRACGAWSTEKSPKKK